MLAEGLDSPQVVGQLRAAVASQADDGDGRVPQPLEPFGVAAVELLGEVGVRHPQVGI
jgi:hypothetical protein